MMDNNNDDDSVNKLATEIEMYLAPILQQNSKLLREGISKIKGGKEQYKKKEDSVPPNIDSRSTNDLSNNLELSASQKLELQKFLEFRFAVNQIRVSLSLDSKSNSEFLQELREQYKLPGLRVITIARLSPFLDSPIVAIANDSDLNSIRHLLTIRVNTSKIIHDLLAIYTAKSLSKMQGSYDILTEFKDAVDLDVLAKKRTPGEDVVFSIKYRRQNTTSIRDFLFSSIDELRKHDLKTGGLNRSVIISYSFQQEKSGKINDRFLESVQQFFPEYVGRIEIVSIPLPELGSFSKMVFPILEKNSNESPKMQLLFSEKPRLIERKEAFVIPSDFINSKIGSVCLWIKVPPLKEFLSKPMNNVYVLAHDTANGWPVNRTSRYANAWGFGLHPNVYDSEKKGPPSSVAWRFWISNESQEQLTIVCSPWREENEKWHHVCIRWNNNQPLLQILINGATVQEHRDYVRHWPIKFNRHVFLGNWGNLHEGHHLNMPLYRLQFGTSYLSDDFIARENKIALPSI